MFQLFLRNNCKKQKPFIAKPLPIEVSVSANPLINNLPQFKYSPSYSSNDWSSLPHITQKCLPKEPTDIKGVANDAYMMISKTVAKKNVPKLIQTRFFLLKFLPLSHYLCQARKSNIAYTFTNFPVNVLNSPELSANFKKYNGSYRNLDFFSTQPSPMGTAVARTKYRKFVKRELHKSLWKIVKNEEPDIARVSGVYCFKFYAVPTTEEELKSVSLDLRIAVKKVCIDKSYNQSLLKYLQLQENLGNNRNLLQSIQKENNIDAANVPGYVPKLPYLVSRIRRS